MFGYIALFIIIFVSSFLRRDEHKLAGYFIGIFLFSAFRYGIGYDYYSYCDIIAHYGTYSTDRIEAIPKFFMLLSSRQGSSDLFFILTSAFISYFYFRSIKLRSYNYIISVLFYLAFPFFFMDQLSIIRQAMATVMVFYAISRYQGDWLAQLICVILAFFCHQSALIALVILLPLQNIGNKLLWIMFIGSLLVGEVVVDYLTTVLQSDLFDSEKFIELLSLENEKEGNITRILVYLIFILFMLSYDKLVEFDENNKYLLSLMCIGTCLFAIFGFNIVIAKRLCVFFYSTSILLIADYIVLTRVPKIVYYIACVVFFIMLVYVGSQNTNRLEDRMGSSPTYPYKTIFNKNQLL